MDGEGPKIRHVMDEVLDEFFKKIQSGKEDATAEL